MDTLTLLIKTVELRPYVFLFLVIFFFSAKALIGVKRTGLFFGVTWATAFACEFSSTRIGVPFGRYSYTGATVGQELYLADIPFMDSLSFTFLLYASYCLALLFLLPTHQGNRTGKTAATKRILPPLVFDPIVRSSWPTRLLTALFFAFIDVVIDPVALRGDRWFLGKIYDYPDAGIHFGVPIANYIGWMIVGLIALSLFVSCERGLPPPPVRRDESVTLKLLGGCGLYYGVLAFNLSVTFWIGEPLLGVTGVLIHVPTTVLLLLRLFGRAPATLSHEWR
ncbi:MAG TPA: carotenoid biosynthesis protein [Nitrospiraceae bacterium]|jgi:putative membrane protein|nr:carotenoid biosynthesis protein [Nitrospiraceae bacterium]